MEIREAEPDACDAIVDMRERAFGPLSGTDREWMLRTVEEEIRDRRMLVACAGRRVVASGMFHVMAQWWNGAVVPLGGVGSVCVAPESRGRGIGRTLAAALVDAIAGRGLALSALYPATASMYRSAGYAFAGARHSVTIRADALRAVGRGAEGGNGSARRAGPESASVAADVLRRVHGSARDAGPIALESDAARRLLDDDGLFAYLADDGLLAYRWKPGTADALVERLVAGSAETARMLWGIVGSGSSIIQSVEAVVAPNDPIFWLIGERPPESVRRVPWMLRVVDAPAAVAARGFPPGLATEVTLALADGLRPGNDGSWRLTIEGGRGRLERADPAGDAVHLGVDAFAALYAGTPVAVLRRSGMLRGCQDDLALARLDAAFAATSFMLDYF